MKDKCPICLIETNEDGHCWEHSSYLKKDNEKENEIEKISKISKIAHEINRAYCKSIDDFSHKPWDELSAHMQGSIIDGVIFHCQNPNISPEESHNNWLKFKKKDGWSYGHEKDEFKKTHPCFLKYSKLPAQQKTKDYIFKAVVDQLWGLL